MSILATNRQARHNYHIEDTLTAGLVLEGWEVKAILAGRANFGAGGAYVRLRDGEAFLEAMSITPLPEARQGLLAECVPLRTRKLLLNRSELRKLADKVALRGYTVVPLAIHRQRKLKLEIGLAKGKKLHDKRESLKQRDLERSRQRGLEG